MPHARRFRLSAPLLLTLAAAMATAPAGRGDTIVLKNGNVYRGVVDRDNTLVYAFDGLKRIVIRDSKIARIEPDASYRSLEWFKIEQPLVVHGGPLPKEVTQAKAEPWNHRGGRLFQYVNGRSSKPIRMEQAIY